MPLNEFERISRFFKPLAEGFAGALGLTDDAALLTCPKNMEMVVTTDAMVEGIHFQASDNAQSIAMRLLRSNLSDLAAMGAEPYAYTLVTSLPDRIDEAWLEAFAGTLGADQKRYGIVLAGGDSTRTQGPITLAITAFGLVPKGAALKRRAELPKAQPAQLYVSGTIGDSFLGLQILLGKLECPDLSKEDKDYLINSHYQPEPRLALGKALRGIALAAIDISDGLAADVAHIAELSCGEVLLEADKIPLSLPAKKILFKQPELLLHLITGGEDYELAFVTESKNKQAVTVLAAELNAPLTRIGQIQAAAKGNAKVIDSNGQEINLKQKGWIHF
jgi:thiamine-monophosphate kinase